MEFSFDRPRDTLNRNNTNSTPASTPASSNASSAGPEPVDPATIQNERLRKAIERNRARQAQAAPRPPQGPPQSPFQSQAQPQPVQQPVQQAAPAARPEPVQQVPQQPVEEVHHQASFLEKPAEPVREPIREPVRETYREPAPEVVQERPTVRERSKIAQHSESASMGPRSTAVVSRRSVAKPEDTEFVPAKRATKKVASQISYTTSSTRKKAKPIDPTFTGYLVKGAWIFCVIMVLRLIFANGGITDFYSQKSDLNERVTQLNDIKKENMQLVREIERMRSDAGYQKKLVRDNLGFIAQDEFLILFPKGYQGN